MRVAVISDIHGNLVALDAVLADLQAETIDQIVCLGDVAATGPQPAEVVQRLRGLAIPTVMGNADAWLLAPPTRQEARNEDWRRFEDIDRWCAGQLTFDDQAYLRTFSSTREVPLGTGSTLLCCHGSPRSYDETMHPTTPEGDLDEMLAEFPATIVAAGHTHIAMVRRHRMTTLVNPGSVGLPVDRVPPAEHKDIRGAPWAEYAVIDCTGDRLSIDLRRAPFDVAALVQIALSSGMPHADWWVNEWQRE